LIAWPIPPHRLTRRLAESGDCLRDQKNFAKYISITKAKHDPPPGRDRAKGEEAEWQLSDEYPLRIRRFA
jgi:hypothetical protein